MEILFRAEVGQSPVLKLRVMITGFPLNLLYAIFGGVTAWLLSDNCHYLGFCHSGLESRESVVHLTADAQQ